MRTVILFLTVAALAACHDARPAIIKPPAEYLARVEAPVPPTDATDENVARFIADQDSAIRRLNAKMDALRAWFAAR